MEYFFNLFIVFIAVLLIACECTISTSKAPLCYNMAELRALRSSPLVVRPTLHNPPTEVKIRKRGRKGGVRARNKKRGFKPVLPSIILENVRSVNNKLDELGGLVKYDELFRTASLMCFSETWLTDKISDSCVNVDNFELFRGDRTKESGKSRGGGVCIYVGSKWCHVNNVSVRYRLCSPICEILTVSARPYYLPRELSHVLVTAIYVPPSANIKDAADIITSHVHDLETSSPDALKILTGDFNHCTLEKSIPGFYQQVSCKTRDDNTLDLLYCNIKDAYVSHPLPPLGLSDHNCVSLRPRYKPRVQREPPETKTIQQWTPEACERLQGCFDCTDWTAFSQDEDDVTKITDSVCSYISWCVESIIPRKTIQVFSNNKPWVTKSIKEVLNKKKKAFREKDKEQLHNVQKEMKKVITEGKNNYKNKIEQKFKSNDMHDVWQGMNLMSGRHKGCVNVMSDSTDYANDLNKFYTRFDCHDFKRERETIINKLKEEANQNSESIVISETSVFDAMKRINPNKACGPDGIHPRAVKTCAEQLCNIFYIIFNMSLNQCTVPSQWKTSCIVPVPKKKSVKAMNDLRPIALTSCIMKIFEKVFLSQFQKNVHNFTDPFQFAYRKSRSVDDALLHVLHSVYSHLENKGSSIRIMFYDFSSAFNTIQPHLLAEKLNKMNVCPNTVLWILDYLSERPQYVKLSHQSNKTSSSELLSNVMFTNTGAPQGTVLSPFLFSLYTADCRSTHENCIIDKYADDTALVGKITNDDNLNYLKEINTFVDWCDQNFLELNVTKTKELIVDFRTTKKILPEPVTIKGSEVERVHKFKYLGVVFDDILSWNQNTDTIMNKINSRLYCLRKLSSFNVSKHILQMFYSSVINSVMTFGLTSWGGNLSKNDSGRIDKTIKRAGKVIGKAQDSLDTLYRHRVEQKLTHITKDSTHPLRDDIDTLKIVRSGRYRIPKAKTYRFLNTFIPSAARIFNENNGRSKCILEEL